MPLEDSSFPSPAAYGDRKSIAPAPTRPITCVWVGSTVMMVITGIMGWLQLSTGLTTIISILFSISTVMTLFTGIYSVLSASEWGWHNVPVHEKSVPISDKTYAFFYNDLKTGPFPNLTFVGKTSALYESRANNKTTAKQIQRLFKQWVHYVHTNTENDRWIPGLERLLEDPAVIHSITYLNHLIENPEYEALINTPDRAVPDKLQAALTPHVERLEDLVRSVKLVLDNMETVKTNAAIDDAVRLSEWTLDTVQPIGTLPKPKATSDDWVKHIIDDYREKDVVS